MSALIYAMIYAGSALMVYNNVRCFGFVKRMRAVSGLNRIKYILPIPLVLLIFFLIGYLAVALFGKPDLMIGGILFGGSVFVFIVFTVMYQIISRLQESNARSDALYEEIRRELADLSKNYLSVLRVNLTKDIVEEDSITTILGVDFTGKRYTELVSSFERDAMIAGRSHVYVDAFSRDTLLKRFAAGTTEAKETLLVHTVDGDPCFVEMHAMLAVQPGTGDVVAFITENICDDKVVNDVLMDKALAGQFDAIALLVGGRFRTAFISPQGAVGVIYPGTETSDYTEHLVAHIAPAICGDADEAAAVIEALQLASVERELRDHEPHEVNFAVESNGETLYKRFSFYAVDIDAKIFLLFASDTTEARREEIERNTRLQDALLEARKASRSKTTFLSNMSHDIRTPMNAIVGYTQFALESDDIEQMRRYLAKIDSSSKYMLALISDVLEMSRIESGKLEIDPEPCSLIMITNDVHDLFDAQMKEKNITFTVDTSAIKTDCVLCDKTRLDRVLLNLISNAYKFTPEGGRVDVSVVQLDDAPEGLGAFELRVKDSGIGMSPEFAHRVFDAFERERNTTSSGIQGTGLGMAIAKRIIDAMGGTIEVQTALDEGTEFIVNLTLELQKKTSDGEPCEHHRPARTQVDLAGKKALLVEDNGINRELAAMMLEALGLEVDEAVNGQIAVETLVSAGPGWYDVVITDIQMPVMDGYEEARAIRALDDPRLASTPIIAMSANAFAEDVKAALDAGMNAHVAKPVDVDKLVEALVSSLS